MDCAECITRSIKSKHEKEKIVCPHCGSLQSNDDYQYPVTVWGEDPAKEYECDDCQNKFWVKENVERYYDVGKEIDEHGDVK